MYNISAQAQSYFENNYRQTLLITGTDRNGTAINITEADVMENGFTLDRYSCNGTKLEVGTAIASEISVKLDNRDGRFNNVIFEGTELYVRVGITNGDLSSQVYTLVPLGYFTPDSQPRALSTITITALDRMTRFDRYLPFPVNWTDENGTDITNESGRAIQLAKALTFPSSVTTLISAACNFVGMNYSIPTSLPNRTLTISSIPNIQQPITLRNIIQWCAGIMGANAWINWNGVLTFSWYNNSATYTTTTANRYNSDLYEDDIAFTGVSYTNTAGVKLVSGASDYTLDLTGNYLASDYTATILPAIYESISGFSYRPFKATVNAAPYLWPMDVITFTDKDGVDRSTVLTNVNYTLNGTTVLEGRGETEQLNAMDSTTGLTSEQAFFVEKAVGVTRALDESLNQENIFNRLTNNGAAQMLILYEGQLYLNASYIQTGTLVADLIKGGTLMLGGENNENGVLNMLDADGDIIGTWNNDGITATKGTFSGSFSTIDEATRRQTVITQGQAFFSSDGNNTYMQLRTLSSGNAEISTLDSVLTISAYKTDGSGVSQLGRLVLRPDGSAYWHLTNGKLNLYFGNDSGSGGLQYNGEDLPYGTFKSADGKTIRVRNGLITSIS